MLLFSYGGVQKHGGVQKYGPILWVFYKVSHWHIKPCNRTKLIPLPEHLSPLPQGNCSPRSLPSQTPDDIRACRLAKELMCNQEEGRWRVIGWRRNGGHVEGRGGSMLQQ